MRCHRATTQWAILASNAATRTMAARMSRNGTAPARTMIPVRRDSDSPSPPPRHAGGGWHDGLGRRAHGSVPTRTGTGHRFEFPGFIHPGDTVITSGNDGGDLREREHVQLRIGQRFRTVGARPRFGCWAEIRRVRGPMKRTPTPKCFSVAENSARAPHKHLSKKRHCRQPRQGSVLNTLRPPARTPAAAAHTQNCWTAGALVRRRSKSPGPTRRDCREADQREISVRKAAISGRAGMIRLSTYQSAIWPICPPRPVRPGPADRCCVPEPRRHPNGKSEFAHPDLPRLLLMCLCPGILGAARRTPPPPPGGAPEETTG